MTTDPTTAAARLVGGQIDAMKTAAGNTCPFLLNDIFSERRKSQCGHLEMLSAERNADNRDAQQ